MADFHSAVRAMKDEQLLELYQDLCAICGLDADTEFLNLLREDNFSAYVKFLKCLEERGTIIQGVVT